MDGLQVSMDEPLLMNTSERLSQLDGEPQEATKLKWCPEQSLERLLAIVLEEQCNAPTSIDERERAKRPCAVKPIF
jgi:hypothetical protein